MNSLNSEELLLNHIRFLNTLAYRYTSCQEKAKDLTQDTLTKAFTKIHQFRHNTNMRGWLATIMRNTFINNYRFNKKWSKVEFQSYHSIADVKKVENMGDYSLERADVFHAMKNLKEDYQTSLHLLIKGFSYKEISEKMGKPLGTIKSHIYAGRKKLRNSLSIQN